MNLIHYFDTIYCHYFRYYVLYKLPKLKFLDSTPVKQEELLTAKEKGAFMKVIKAEDSEVKLNA